MYLNAGDELHPGVRGGDAPERLRPSHPAAHGDWKNRPPGGDRSGRGGEWYLAVYADAFEWVGLPNTHGMALHADGGLLGPKPCTASGAYIDRMPDYCASCPYDSKKKLGPEAWSVINKYWEYHMRNEKRPHPRMGTPYRTLGRRSAEKRRAIRRDAPAFMAGLAVWWGG